MFKINGIHKNAVHVYNIQQTVQHFYRLMAVVLYIYKFFFIDLIVEINRRNFFPLI